MHRYIPGAACWWPTAPKPSAHRRNSARCTSRRWRLPVYSGRGWTPPAEPPPESTQLPSGSTTIGPWPVVSKCALSRGPAKRTERPGHPRTLPSLIFSCWLITIFLVCAILPQMNRQPMCIWMVKPPFTQYIAKNHAGRLRPPEWVSPFQALHG